jgi:hypothetical protein
MPLILVITDVDTPPVHCQRHIYVYHFVYLRPTQAAHEYSIEAALGGRERLLRSSDCYCIWGDTVEVVIIVRLILALYNEKELEAV